MSAFFRKFLQEEAKGGPRAYLAAFGKHPGWNDHIDDLGLDTETLVMAKRMIYLEGLSSQIDAGAWEKLEGDALLEGFDHTFLWQRGGNVLLGSMVSSRDGKGRTRYPMVVCAQFDRVPLTRVLYELRPMVEGALNECRATTSADEVRRILDRTRQSLQSAVTGSLTSPGVSAPPTESLVSQMELGPDDEGLFRILYQVKSQLSLWAPGRVTIKMHQEHAVLSGCLRVPQVFSNVSLGLHVWSHFMASQLDPLAARLFVWPRSGRWLDILVGEPVGADFFGLRATTKALPAATEVPYEMDAEFRERARGVVASIAPGSIEPKSIFQDGTATRGRLEAATDVVEKMKASAAPLKPTRRGLVIGLCIVAAIAALALLAILLSEPVDESGKPLSSRPSPTAPDAVPTAQIPAAQPVAQPEQAPATTVAVDTMLDAAPAAPVVAPADVQEAWTRLCRDYYEWLGALQAALRNSDRRARWERDEDLKRDVVDVLAAASKQRRELDPRVLAGVQGDLQGLAATPPAALLEDPAVREKILGASAVVVGIANGLQQWPRLVRIRESRATLAGLGWTRPIDGPAYPDNLPLDDNLVAAVDKFLGMQDILSPVAGLAAEVMPRIDQLDASGDPLLADAGAALRRRLLSVSSVGALNRELQQVQKMVDPVVPVLANVWQTGAVARERFIAERTLSPGLADNPAAAIEAWLQGVNAYTIVPPDNLPLPASEFRPGAAHAEELLQQLVILSSEADAASLKERLASLVSAWSDLRATVVVQKDLPTVRESARKVSAGMNDLAASLASEVARRSDPDAWLKQVRAITIDDAPAVQQAWAARRDALLNGWNAASATSDVRGFVDFQGRIDRLAALFRSIAAADPLARSVTADGADFGPFGPQIDAVAASLRDERRTEVLAQIPFENGMATVSAAEFWSLPPVEAVVAAHNQSLEQLRHLASGMLAMAKALAAGAPWQDVAGTSPDWKSGFEALRARLGEGPMAAAAAEMVQLEGIVAASDPATLASTAADPDWTRAVTAWLRLGQVEAWPANIDELDSEGRLAAELRTRADLEATDPKVRERLDARLRDEERSRWMRALPRLRTDADLARAYQSMASFGVAEADLPPAHRFNLVLVHLRGQGWSGLDSAAGLAARDAAVRALASVPGIEKAAAAPIVDKLRAVSFDDETIDFSRQGPGLKGWTLEKSSDPTHVAYVWKGPQGRVHRLDFLLVSADGQNSYLAAAETPVQLFIDWVDHAAQWPAILEAHRILLEDFDSGDPRRGPRSYTFEKGNAAGKGGRFEPPASQWLVPAINRYPAEEAPPSPTGATPVNYVSFAAAQLFADMVGCRLPFAGEWSAARAKLPETPANLRDLRWQHQLEFQRTLRDSCWPDSDIFVPGARIASVAMGANAKSATAEDDGSLWFADVPAGSVSSFDALVGNVSEYVMGADDRVGVIGGSALSPPEIPVDDFLPVDKWDATRGFADVGFRLAFSIGKLSGPAEVQRILQTAPFLR